MQKIKIAVLALITCLSFSQLAIPAANATAPTISNLSAGSTVVGAHTYMINISTPPAAGFYPRLQFRSTSDSSIVIAFKVRFTTIGDHNFIFNPLILGSENVSRDPNVDYFGSTDVNRKLDPGTYSITLDYFDSDSNLLTQTISSITFLNPCSPGTYSSNGGQPLDNSGCLLATAGHYVATSKATSETECPAGTFQFSSGAMNCTHTQPGTYTSTPASVTATDCVKGTYQPDEQKTSCITSPANFYVSATAATAATACPTNYTSPEGSDSLDDCIAPAPAVTPSIAKGKKKSAKALAVEIGMTVPTKSKVTLKLNKASKKFCKISGSKIKATKFGTCNVTVTVKPKKGTKSVKTTALTVS